ncbi:MAG: hypothetical protein OES38_00410 [Gammaproteobacteria bacterium]|nr:hypothetical protein [Gammaproteobacteria bacterium]
MSNENKGKVDFASAAWIDITRRELEALVAVHGKPGVQFGFCEIFTDAPSHISASGEVAWYFRTNGKSVEVAAGTLKGADVTITTDYAGVLPQARQYYTPEILAERAKEPPGAAFDSVQGDLSLVPDYLVELHNRLAVITA